MNTEIATVSKTQLAELETRVRNGLNSFVDVGNALAAIRDGKGYQLKGFKTFESYCEKEFGFTDRHGRRLIAAAETTAKVEKVFGEAPRVESVAREFEKIANDTVKMEKVKAILSKQKKTAGTATAEDVATAVQRVNGSKPVAKPEPKHEAPKTVSRLSDVCPHCGDTPDRYEHSEEVWTGSCCGKPVLLHVVTLQAKACKACKKPIEAHDQFCQYCGALV